MYYVCYNVYDPVTRDSAESCDSIPTKDYVGPKTEVIKMTADYTGSNYIISWPNPFSSNFTIRLSLEADQKVDVYLTDLSGRKLKSILSETLSKGSHDITYDASSMASGTYLLMMVNANGQSISRVVVKK
jgi:hypothetical protein